MLLSDEEFERQFNEQMELRRASMKLEYAFRKLNLKIPFIYFPSHWGVAIIYPFGGLFVRFRVALPNKEGSVSVYLDVNDMAGCMGEPYWEVYPYENGEGTARVLMDDTDELIRIIKKALKGLPNKKLKMGDKIKRYLSF